VKTVMPFGKFVGTPLGAIPPPYLRWVVMNTDLDYRYPGLKQEIKSIIRNGPGRSSAGSQYPRLAPNTNQATPRELLGSGTSSGESAGPTCRRQNDAVRIKIAGTSYHQLVVKASVVGVEVRLDPEPTNPHDPNAVRLINIRLESSTGNGWLGFIPMKYSQLFSKGP